MKKAQRKRLTNITSIEFKLNDNSKSLRIANLATQALNLFALLFSEAGEETFHKVSHTHTLHGKRIHATFTSIAYLLLTCLVSRTF